MKDIVVVEGLVPSMPQAFTTYPSGSTEPEEYDFQKPGFRLY